MIELEYPEMKIKGIAKDILYSYGKGRTHYTKTEIRGMIIEGIKEGYKLHIDEVWEFRTKVRKRC